MRATRAAARSARCPVRAARRAGMAVAVVGIALAVTTTLVVLHAAPASAAEARSAGPHLIVAPHGAQAVRVGTEQQAVRVGAEQQAVQVGIDGVHYGDQLAQPLFTGLPVLVPGDEVSVPLWVRNDGEQAGQVRLSGTSAWSTSAVFADQLRLTAAEAGASTSTEVPLAAAEECALLVAGPVLEPGESSELAVTLAFSGSTTGRDAHDARAGLDFVVALRDPAEPASAGADCAGTIVPAFPADPSTGSGSGRAGDAIAATGLPGVLLTMVGAVAVVLAVPLLVLARRRRGSRS